MPSGSASCGCSITACSSSWSRSSPPRPACARASTYPRPRPSIPTGGRGSARCCAGTPASAERLTIEITETAAIQDVDDTRGFVARVKDLGCRIAIDDFGAGYTSFRNLRKLGVDMVKIDGAFVQNLTALGGRPRLRADADRSRPPAAARNRGRMGAGREGRRISRGLGLRLSAGLADRARRAGAAVGGSAQAPHGLKNSGLANERFAAIEFVMIIPAARS